MTSGTYERTAIWLMSESGDGKSSLAKRLGANCAETDRVFIELAENTRDFSHEMNRPQEPQELRG